MAATHDQPVIIEAALNGGTPKSRNPNVPRTPGEIAADALRCLRAGASIIHNHNDDALFGGTGVLDPAPYAEAWRAILAERPDALLYPTMAGGGGHTTAEQRIGHVVALAEAGLLRMGLVDPGSVSLGGLDESGLPAAVDVVYQTTYGDARSMFAMCERLRLGVTISIFEPGFLRLALAFHRAGRLPAGAMIKLYFGAAPGVSFGLPPTLPSLEAYLAMLDGTGLPWSVSAISGDVVGCGLARLALERGGHVQVGLEPYGGPGTPANEELVRQVVELAREVGRPVATCQQAAAMLGLPQRG